MTDEKQKQLDKVLVDILDHNGLVFLDGLCDASVLQHLSCHSLSAESCFSVRPDVEGAHSSDLNR